MLVYPRVTKKELSVLVRNGYRKEEPKANESMRLRGDASIILYNSGKLVVNGSESAVMKVKRILSTAGVKAPVGTKAVQEVKAQSRLPITVPAVGSDEVLKGDTFGGIVVCGFLADENIRQKLKELRVKDSKKLTNAEISRLGIQLEQMFPSNYHCESIFPKEYNQLNTKKNVTEILDMLHEKCYKKLSRGKPIHIVDKYPGCKVGDRIEERAESRYLEVAAASVIAGYEGMKQIRQLEQMSGFFIPLGSTHVTDALMELKRKCLQPQNYVKMQFSNVRKMF